MKSFKTRLAAIGGTAALTASLLAAGAMPAPAVPLPATHDDFKFDGVGVDTDYVIRVQNLTEGKRAGYIEWRADGDTLIASDQLGDGYGIVGHLSTGRVASTAGHNAPYTVEAGGNLPENHNYTMWVCVVQDSFSSCSSDFKVRS